jgi:hypothetical protein
MQFSQWLTESTLTDLYRSAVEAFPNTTKRQYSTDLVKITELTWLPFIGTKSLFIRGLAQSGETGKEYKPLILFKGVNFHNERDQAGLVEIAASDGQQYLLEKLSLERNEVLIRCPCKDFTFRFSYYDHLDHSLYGRKGRRYVGQGLWEANPAELPGMCKHLMKLARVIKQSGVMGA